MEFCGNLICPLLIFNAGRRAGALAAQPQCKLNWQCPLETADVTLISSALQPTLNHACLEKFNIPEANLISLRPIITAADRPWNPSGRSNESPTPAPVKLHFNRLLVLNIHRPGHRQPSKHAGCGPSQPEPRCGQYRKYSRYHPPCLVLGHLVLRGQMDSWSLIILVDSEPARFCLILWFTVFSSFKQPY